MRVLPTLLTVPLALIGTSCSSLSPNPGDIPYSDPRHEAEVLALARQIREAPVNVGLRYRLVKIYLDELMFERATRELRAIVRCQPKDPQAYQLLSLVQAKGPNNDVVGAIETLRAGLRAAPGESSLHADLALRYLDRYELAAAEREATLAADPKAAPRDRATAHLILEGICRLGGRTGEAASHAETAATLDPTIGGAGAASVPPRFPAMSFDTDLMSRIFSTHPEMWLRAQRLDELLRRRSSELP